MDWTNPIGSAVSGGFGLIGSAVNYAFQKKLAQQQNEYNLNMWNLQNEYNSPQAQMKRYEEAGLNPALMYGQVSSGNAPHAPEQVTPSAPNFTQEMQELANAFNIEGLRTAIANRKKAEADAENAKTESDRNRYVLEAERHIGYEYDFDPVTGMLVPLSIDRIHENNMNDYKSLYYQKRILNENFRNNSLLVPRAGLIGSQKSLNVQRQKLLAPQIRMYNYEAKYKPWSFWIGNVKNGVQAVMPMVTPFF